MKIKFTLAIVLSTLFTLSGCAIGYGSSPEMEKITNQQAEIETLKVQQAELQEKLALWQEMQPDVQRLIEIEDELNTLIQQLRELTEKNKVKTSEAHPVFMLQLASLSNQESLKETWLSQQKLHPEILNGLAVRYQQVEINGRQYYRLKAGEFKQKADALETCQSLIAKQTSCIVVNGIGNKL